MRISDWSSDVCSSDLQGFAFGACRAIGRLAQSQLVQQFLETLAVFGHVDGLGAGADNRHTIGFQGTRKLQRRLAAIRSEERRVGKEFVSTCRSRWSPCHEKKKRNRTKANQDQQ